MLASASASASCIIFEVGICERGSEILRGLTGFNGFHGLCSIESAVSACRFIRVGFFATAHSLLSARSSSKRHCGIPVVACRRFFVVSS